jgi:predicted RNA binding protein YcfA (HicA-like mRNA interferase family)
VTQTPRGVTARILVRALEADGFVLQRSRGSHRIYKDSRRPAPTEADRVIPVRESVAVFPVADTASAVLEPVAMPARLKSLESADPIGASPVLQDALGVPLGIVSPSDTSL